MMLAVWVRVGLSLVLGMLARLLVATSGVMVLATTMVLLSTPGLRMLKVLVMPSMVLLMLLIVIVLVLRVHILLVLIKAARATALLTPPLVLIVELRVRRHTCILRVRVIARLVIASLVRLVRVVG